MNYTECGNTPSSRAIEGKYFHKKQLIFRESNYTDPMINENIIITYVHYSVISLTDILHSSKKIYLVYHNQVHVQRMPISGHNVYALIACMVDQQETSRTCHRRYIQGRTDNIIPSYFRV